MFKFLTPTTLDEALQMLDTNEGARILAGGTDLIVQQRDGMARCRYMVDVKKLPELAVFGYTNEGLEIGGVVTCNQLLEADFLEERHGVLKMAAATLANTLLRNRATVIGNLCNASPGGDMIPACLVLDGTLHTAAKGGGRKILLRDFFVGVKKTVLAPDEIVVKLVLARKAGQGAYFKKRRIHGHDLAQVGVAGFYGEDGLLRVGCAAVGPTPILLDDFAPMQPKELADHRKDIVDKVAEGVSPISDVRSTREYRLAILRLFTGRMVDAFAEKTEVQG